MIQQQESESEENPFFLKVPRKCPQRRQFTFPSTQVIFQQHTSLKQLMRLINLMENPENCQLFKCRILQKKYGYMKCKYCTSYLNFKLGQDLLTESSGYNNYHIHTSNIFKKTQQLKIIQFIDEYGGNRNSLMDITTRQFNISKRRFYYIMNKAEQNIQFNELFIQLQNRGYDILLENRDRSMRQYPELLIYSTPQMTQMYKRFGDVCTFDITYNIIKQRNTNKKQWGVGVFSGLDTNMRILIFAVVLISNQSTDFMEKLFEGFFRLYPKQPGVIITDEQLSMIAALRNLKDRNIFRGVHLLDTFHILKNVKKKVEKRQFDTYKKLIKDRTQQIFEETINQAVRNQIDQNKLKTFLNQKAKNCCFSMIPNVFIGMSSSNSRNEKLNDIIKGFIPCEVHWATFFNRMEKVVNHIRINTNKKLIESKPYQILFKDYGIGEVRKRVEQKVFNYFLSNYVRALRSNCQETEPNVFVCWNASGKWEVVEHQCKCGIQEKSGIPCQHVLRVFWNQNKRNYISLFHKRWILDQQPKKEERGRPRNSRKNIMK